MINRIKEYFQTCDFDIRKTRSARFFDQKVQPDVLSAVCECILQCSVDGMEFTVNNIRFCDYSNELVMEIFNKPEIEKAENEYDKFFAQPLKMLAYCGVLIEKKDGNTNKYTIAEKDFIEYISLRDRDAYYFLSLYLEKVLKDSDIWKHFEIFFTKQDQNSLDELKKEYLKFLQSNTNIKKDLEPTRMFNTLLRILAFNLKKLGTKKGKVAEINYNDFLYNQPNWRDIKKDKSITREAFNAVFFEREIDNDKF
jgi:hypothetical protein